MMQKEIADWEKEDAHLQAAHRNRRINEVEADDKDHLKVIAEPRLLLEEDPAPTVLCAA